METGQNNWELFKQRLLNILFSKDFLLSAVLTVGIFSLLMGFWSVFAPFITSFILAYLLNPMVLFWEKKLKRFSRSRGEDVDKDPARYRVGGVLIVFATIILVGLLFVVPFTLQLSTNLLSMAEEVGNIQYKPILQESVVKVKSWKSYMPEVMREQVDEVLSNLTEYLEQYQEQIEKTLVNVNSWLGGALKKLGKFLLGFSNKAFKKTMDLMLIPILVFYLLLDFHKARPLFLKIVPSGYREWMGCFITATDRTLNQFVKGQLTIAFLFGILMSIGLGIIGIKFWLVIGPLSGIANLIPYLGVIFGLGPALVIGVYQGALAGGVAGVFAMLLKVLIVFAIIQMIDGFVFQPRILGGNVELHPLIVMLALFLGGEIMGVYGMIFAVPAAAIIKVLLEELHGVLYERFSPLLGRELKQGYGESI
jgi:predicted PurR-regulated permease PerM